MKQSKEEVAMKYVPCRCDEAYTSRGLTAPDCPYHSEDVESAMDEWAEQQAIEFAEWKDRHFATWLREPHEELIYYPRFMVLSGDVGGKGYTISETYQIFLQTQNKDK